MSEMIERGAKVLFGWQYGHDRWDEAEPETREDCCEASRAFIEAMREPTADMLGAIHGCSPDTPDRWARPIALEKWTGAIDAALDRNHPTDLSKGAM